MGTNNPLSPRGLKTIIKVGESYVAIAISYEALMLVFRIIISLIILFHGGGAIA